MSTDASCAQVTKPEFSTILQVNERHRDEAGDEEGHYMDEHTRLLQEIFTLHAFYESLGKAAKQLLEREGQLVSQEKTQLVAEGMPPDFVKALPGAFVRVDERQQAASDVLVLMEHFRDVSTASLHLAGVYAE